MSLSRQQGEGAIVPNCKTHRAVFYASYGHRSLSLFQWGAYTNFSNDTGNVQQNGTWKSTSEQLFGDNNSTLSALFDFVEVRCSWARSNTIEVHEENLRFSVACLSSHHNLDCHNSTVVSSPNKNKNVFFVFVLKCAPHVQHDCIFFWFNQSNS